MDVVLCSSTCLNLLIMACNSRMLYHHNRLGAVSLLLDAHGTEAYLNAEPCESHVRLQTGAGCALLPITTNSWHSTVSRHVVYLTVVVLSNMHGIAYKAYCNCRRSRLTHGAQVRKRNRFSSKPSRPTYAEDWSDDDVLDEPAVAWKGLQVCSLTHLPESRCQPTKARQPCFAWMRVKASLTCSNASVVYICAVGF